MKKILLLVFLSIALAQSCTSQQSKKVSPKKGDQTYATGQLQGSTLSDLYADYLGIKPGTTLGKTLTTDFEKNLTHMWEKKDQQSNSVVVSQAKNILLTHYQNSRTFTTFGDYENHVSTVIAAVYKSINWNDVGSRMHLRQEDISIVKNIATSFNGRYMLAYLMTELMPSKDGALNKSLLDFLLRNAGKEYIESIPALFDDRASFGPYQFTSYAIYSTTTETRGASIINVAIKNNTQKIPGSVIMLRGDDHHRAAYLFIIYNLCELIKTLSAKEKVTLANCWKKKKDDVFLYCATAHHSPVYARKSARRWLDHGAKSSYEKSCSKNILAYAQKTRNNL